MSFKRRVLSALGEDVLPEIGRGLELDVTTRLGVEELRDALAKSKWAKVDAIVQESLSRDTLEDICGAVGLDDTGKEKAALVERILAAGGDKAANGAGYRIDPPAVRGRKAAEGGGALGALLSGLDAERHASGAHHTAHDDIMRVACPTIVEPWRKRIVAATSLKELTELRRELFAFRVLDPACGSGNFRYVAFRELYQLDTELLSRMREFPSMPDHLDPRDSRWFSTACIEPPPGVA